jgi:hypothetical protein
MPKQAHKRVNQPSSELLDRIKTVIGVETDSDLAKTINCDRSQISRIRRCGFPQYVQAMFEILLPLLLDENDSTTRQNDIET